MRARPEQTQLEDLSDASFLGKLLVSPANVKLDWKVIARYKHSSLFGLVISNEEKKFCDISSKPFDFQNRSPKVEVDRWSGFGQTPSLTEAILETDQYLVSLRLHQGDQKIGVKNCPNFGKSSQNSCQIKKAKISASKFNLKVQNIYINPHLNS